jgi:5-methylcytosine-specific restriction endonuclease McrA
MGRKEPRLKWAGSQNAEREYQEAVRQASERAEARRAIEKMDRKVKAASKQRVKKSRRRKQKLPRFTGTYHEYLASPQWAAMRERAFAIHGRKCNICGREYDLIVHHKDYKRLFRENPRKDLEIRCHGCHNNGHEKDKGAIDPITARFLSVMRCV